MDNMLQKTRKNLSVCVLSFFYTVLAPQNYKWQNGKAWILIQSSIVAKFFYVVFRVIFLQFREIKNYLVKISRNTKFWQNNFNFSRNTKKISQNTKYNIMWKFRKIKKTKFCSNSMQDWSERGGILSTNAHCTLFGFPLNRFPFCHL